MIYINVDLVLELHELSINRFGGQYGLRDLKLLDSAVMTPFATFDEKDLYPTDLEKTIRMSYLLVMNHPFIDGNKRIGFFVLVYLLRQLNLKLSLDNASIIKLFLNLAASKISCDDFKNKILKILSILNFNIKTIVIFIGY